MTATAFQDLPAITQVALVISSAVVICVLIIVLAWEDRR